MTGEPAEDLTLEDVLISAAEDLANVRRTDAKGSAVWSVGGSAFVALDQARAEFRLDPIVVRAALRTPDTGPSVRGPDWIVFAPETLDDGAIDRAEAWFLSAYRRATGPHPAR